MVGRQCGLCFRVAGGGRTTFGEGDLKAGVSGGSKGQEREQQPQSERQRQLHLTKNEAMTVLLVVKWAQLMVEISNSALRGSLPIGHHNG